MPGRCAITHRVDCSGHLHLGPQHHPPHIPKAACLARGCCYDASAAASIAPQLTAAKTAKQRNRVPLSSSQCYYAAEGIALTHIHVINSNHFDAGYVSHLDCPPGLGLSCPGSSAGSSSRRSTRRSCGGTRRCRSRRPRSASPTSAAAPPSCCTTTSGTQTTRSGTRGARVTRTCGSASQ